MVDCAQSIAGRYGSHADPIGLLRPQTSWSQPTTSHFLWCKANLTTKRCVAPPKPPASPTPSPPTLPFAMYDPVPAAGVAFTSTDAALSGLVAHVRMSHSVLSHFGRSLQLQCIGVGTGMCIVRGEGGGGVHLSSFSVYVVVAVGQLCLHQLRPCP